jgi:hypothetical protein
LKLTYVATIITVLVLILGVAMISPLFIRPGRVQPKQKLLITFTVLESADVVDWCMNVSSLLQAYKMPATVFIVGLVAQQYPQTVISFGDKVDIGSSTYNYSDLTTISDYSLKLKEVEEGKTAVDAAGHLDSKVFRAPYGATDQDIYSLLSRAGILADFSYKSQYNVYLNGQFIRFDANTYEAQNYQPDFFLALNKSSVPWIIDFKNTYPTSGIESYLSRLKSGDFDFENASQLVGLSLTNRGSLDISYIAISQANLAVCGTRKNSQTVSGYAIF